MKRTLLYIGIAIVLTSVFLIAGLYIKNDKSYSQEQEAIDFLKEIKSYESDLTIEVNNARESNKYSGKQIYIKDVGYKLVLDDSRTFIFQGDDIKVKSEDGTKSYTVDKSFDEVYKYGFVGEYIGLIYTNEDLKFKRETYDGEECIIITTLIPGNNDNLFRGSMYYSINSHVPKKVVIFDNKDKERVVYTYNKFIWTEKVEDMDLGVEKTNE